MSEQKPRVLSIQNGTGIFDQLSARNPIVRSPEERIAQNVWDHLYQEEGIIHPQAYSFFEHVMNSFTDRGVKTVVDAACGESARHIAPLLKAGFNVVGAFDLSPTALQLTKRSLEQQGLPVPQLVGHDLFERPWPFKNVDAVLLIQALYHGYEAEIEKALRIVHDEVLNSKGTLIATFTTEKYRALTGLNTDGMSQEEKDALFDEPEPSTFVPKAGREKGLPHHLFSPQDLFRLLEKVGYSHVHVYEDEKRNYIILDARKNGNGTTV